MDVAQRDIWWAALGEPVGSVAGYRRPVVIVQSDAINISRLTSYLCIPVTGIKRSVVPPWNLVLQPERTGLESESMAQANLMLTVDAAQLIERIGRISERQLQQLFRCLDIALGRA